MASKTFYEKILEELHYRQTHEIREFLKIKRHTKKKALNRQYLNEQIEKIQIAITEEDVKETFKNEFAVLIKCRWNVIGHGNLNKREFFKTWLHDEFFLSNNLIYIFWGVNKSCLYVGRTGKGGSRPTAHFVKFWFSKTKYIEIYDANKARSLNKFECIAIHFLMPKYNQKKSARQKRTDICPICDNQKFIARKIEKVFL
jgi:hypothetical protein